MLTNRRWINVDITLTDVATLFQHISTLNQRWVFAGSPCIDIRTFELVFQFNFELNFEHFDINFTFFMQMSHTKLEITKNKIYTTSIESFGNASHSDIQKIMDKCSLWKSDSFLSFPQSVIFCILVAMW